MIELGDWRGWPPSELKALGMSELLEWHEAARRSGPQVVYAVLMTRKK